VLGHLNYVLLAVIPLDLKHGPCLILVLNLGQDRHNLANYCRFVGFAEEQMLTHMVNDTLEHELGVAFG
jgi:hypothetical protein